MDINIGLLFLFMFSSLSGQNENCNIQLDEKIDLKTLHVKTLELDSHFNIFDFYSELIRCELISDFDYQVMHDANLLDKLKNIVYDNSIDSIVSYNELLIQFNLEMKTNEFIDKREQIVNWNNLLTEIRQSPIDLSNWKTDSIKLIRLGVDEKELQLWKEHIITEKLEGELYKYFFEQK